MTSLTSFTSSAANAGRTMMNARIAAAVSSGSISKTDQTALGSALDSIDSTLAGGSASDTSTTGKSMKDRMDSLIDDQVTKGTLTSDQAGELKQFFAAGGPQGGRPGDGGGQSEGGSSTTGVAATGGASRTGGASGVHGHHGHHGARPAASSDDDATASTSTDATSAAGSTDTEKTQLDTLMAFLDKMRSSIGSQTTYGATTASGSTSSADSTGLVFSQVA